MAEDYETTSLRFSEWLLQTVLADATGAAFDELPVAPGGKFWLGVLAPEAVARESALGERADRVTPCELGFRFRSNGMLGTTARVTVSGYGWRRTAGNDRGGTGADDASVDTSERKWKKSRRFEVGVTVELKAGDERLGKSEIEAALRQADLGALSGELALEHRRSGLGDEAILTFVNTSPIPSAGEDNGLYEVQVEVSLDRAPIPYLLEALPNSFRYDRRIPAYGVNCGIKTLDSTRFVTRDATTATKPRPDYWDESSAGPRPDFRFSTLSEDPRPTARALVTAMRQWRRDHWSETALKARSDSEDWVQEHLEGATAAAGEFDDEIARVEKGVKLLEDNDVVRQAFAFANEAMLRSTMGRYDSWRPFQVGFQLAVLPSLLEDDPDRDVVDTLWFATGGGKTETYLGLVVTAAFLDRARGKNSGVTAWARFPLRMLSLQQTQRFADVLAAAETVRRARELGGDPFSLGFLVGGSSTPNRLPANPSVGDADYRDQRGLGEYQVLIRCPFCRSEQISMAFDRHRWTLDHLCNNQECAWSGALPFRVVDDEIFRFLPTVLVGTIDKTAGLGFQASMAGLYGPPYGRCSEAGHGFTYAPRSTRPHGCLFPGCETARKELDQDARLFAPTLRIQDELHLLRDSLGAMSAHYEAALDHLQNIYGPPAKILASSATLSGYETQVQVLYGRRGRIFPLPGPRHDHSFWSVKSGAPARQYLGLAPRGVTLDFASDRLVEALQKAVRRALEEPDEVARQAGVDATDLPRLVSDYGTDVSYGSTLRDVEAAARSFETQIPIEGSVNAVTMTGRAPFETVREALQRLERPEPSFDDRIHLVAASSMISHGVDVDRLNVMVMMGLPLTTAEFIQATARVGRARPGLVFVLHKMLRERDAAVHRSFDHFVTHGDRLVEAVPVTRRSRSVLARTFPGLLMARLLGVHERASVSSGGPVLTTVQRWRTAMRELPIGEAEELTALRELLDATQPLDTKLVDDLARYWEMVRQAVLDPATEEKFTGQLLQRAVGNEPMLSLRDVDIPVPVYSQGGRGA